MQLPYRLLPVALLSLSFPAVLRGQSSAPASTPTAVMFQFERFADVFGSRLVAAFDSIPAAQYVYRPTPSQQTVGYIAQHLEGANYGLCGRLGVGAPARTAKDSLADTVKARWPKDTLVARLRASLRYCDAALDHVGQLDSPAVVSTLLAFETDLAEHYSQIAVYMRLLGLVPPSALAPAPRATISLPKAALDRFVGTYEIVPGQTLLITVRDSTLAISSSVGGAGIRAWPLSATEFFVKDADAEITFTQDSAGAVTGLVLHQFDRDRLARRLP